MLTEDLYAPTSQPTVAEGPAFSITTVPKLVATSVGGTNCDVWLEGPTPWLSGGELILSGTIGSLTFVLARAALAKAVGENASGVFRGLALSLRNRPCDAFSVQVLWTGGTPPAGTGRVLLQVFEGGGVARAEQAQRPSGSDDAPLVARPASRALQQATVNGVATSDTTVLSTSGATDCDVWVLVPKDWEADLEIALFAKVGTARVELARTDISGRATPDGSGVSALAVSTRGRLCAGFDVTLRSSRSALTGVGHVYAQLGDGGSPPLPSSSLLGVEIVGAPLGTAASPHHVKAVPGTIGIAGTPWVATPETRRTFTATTTSANVTSGLLGYLYHAGSVTARVRRITLHHRSNISGTVVFRRITDRVGGSFVTEAAYDGGSTSAVSVYSSGTSTTATGGDLLCLSFSGTDGRQIWEPPPGGEPIVLPASGSTTGLEARISFASGTPSSTEFRVTFDWTID